MGPGRMWPSGGETSQSRSRGWGSLACGGTAHGGGWTQWPGSVVGRLAELGFICNRGSCPGAGGHWSLIWAAPCLLRKIKGSEGWLLGT